MRNFLFFTTCLISFLCFAQREVKPFSNIIIGNAGSVLYEDLNTDQSTVPYHYFEYHWAASVSTDINKWFRVGVERRAIYTNREIDAPLSLYGGYIQWDYVPKFRSRGYIEVNYHRGNYCDCNDRLPFRKNGLDFFGAGTGFDWAFSRHFHLDMGMNISWANAGEYGWSVFGEYFLGLDVHLFPASEPQPTHRGKTNRRL